MTVAKIMNAVGFDIQQSDYYYDEESTSYREIDIIAQLSKDTNAVNYSVNYLIECKVCRSNPWIIFKEKENTSRRNFLHQMPGNKLGDDMTRLYKFSETVLSLPILCNQPSIGYAVVESLRNSDKKDNSYAALMAISKALQSFSQHPEYTHAAGKKICEIFVPVVVISGELFEAYLDDNNKIALNKVPSSSIYWSNPVCGNRSTIINIVTEAELAQFSSQAKKSAAELLDLVITDGKIEKKLRKSNRTRRIRTGPATAKKKPSGRAGK